jgi:hypothetical protein
MSSVPYIGSNESSGRMGAGERIMIPTGMTPAKDRVMPALRIKPRGLFWVSCQPGKFRALRYKKVSITSSVHRRGTGCGRMTGFLLQAFHASCISNMVVTINTFHYGRWRGTVIFVPAPIRASDQSRFLRVLFKTLIIELVVNPALVGEDWSVSPQNQKGPVEYFSPMAEKRPRRN